jgi:tyrosine-protein phosphatase YwqE
LEERAKEIEEKGDMLKTIKAAFKRSQFLSKATYLWQKKEYKKAAEILVQNLKRLIEDQKETDDVMQSFLILTDCLYSKTMLT